MTDQNPATPGSATAPAEPAQANPGNNEQGSNQPSGSNQAPATSMGQGQNQEGKVTISTEEYGNLQRNSARLQSLQRRTALKSRTPSRTNSNPNADPAIAEELDSALAAKEAAEARALELEVKTSVRDILDKPEYKDLPVSTRNLILKNPASLSNANNLEEALLDVEDFIREAVVDHRASNPGTQTPAGQAPAMPPTAPAPVGHEAPASVSAGGPANPATAGMEDTSKLTGSSRSRAALRNAIKKSKSQ